MANVDDDAFYVLTAALLTPTWFPSVLADDYPAACETLGLTPADPGYGLILGQDSDGARWTVVVSDTALVACAIAAWDCGLKFDLTPPEHGVTATLAGWPLALAVAVPELPEPHDPADPPGLVLAPADPTEWGAAQRRLGADEIARQWALFREQVDARVTFVPAGEQPHDGVTRALHAANDYRRNPPPMGRIRSAFASDGARILRVDGPGWSLVARTDDIAFVLLDEAPGEVLPVGRGPELPDLLHALDKLAREPMAA